MVLLRTNGKTWRFEEPGGLFPNVSESQKWELQMIRATLRDMVTIGYYFASGHHMRLAIIWVLLPYHVIPRQDSLPFM